MHMITDNTPYQPIDCEFHDLLENLALSRRPTEISFLGESGVTLLRDAVITDVFARNGNEFASLATGELLRLDQLLEVGGAQLVR